VRTFVEVPANPLEIGYARRRAVPQLSAPWPEHQGAITPVDDREFARDVSRVLAPSSSCSAPGSEPACCTQRTRLDKRAPKVDYDPQGSGSSMRAVIAAGRPQGRRRR